MALILLLLFQLFEWWIIIHANLSERWPIRNPEPEQHLKDCYYYGFGLPSSSLYGGVSREFN